MINREICAINQGKKKKMKNPFLLEMFFLSDESDSFGVLLSWPKNDGRKFLFSPSTYDIQDLTMNPGTQTKHVLRTMVLLLAHSILHPCVAIRTLNTTNLLMDRPKLRPISQHSDGPTVKLSEKKKQSVERFLCSFFVGCIKHHILFSRRQFHGTHGPMVMFPLFVFLFLVHGPLVQPYAIVYVLIEFSLHNALNPLPNMPISLIHMNPMCLCLEYH